MQTQKMSYNSIAAAQHGLTFKTIFKVNNNRVEVSNSQLA